MIDRLRHSRLFRFATGLVAGAALLAACSQMPQAPRTSAAVSATPSAAPAAPAPQLGTQWGEGLESKTRTVITKRLSDQPDDVASLGYNEASAVRRSVGSNPESRLSLMLADGDVEWSVLGEDSRPLPLQRARRGSGGEDMFRLAGVQGSRYTLRFRNLSERSYEVIATVDGLDVLNGKPGSLRNGGYVLRPLQALTIEGFRKSENEVAAFRFSAPGRAYAANTEAGDVRNIGVIGAALFELEERDAPRRQRRDATPSQPSAFPADGAYAPPPRYRK
ncbi:MULTISPECIES: hypothetical protein [unclassified Variovorax]|jgi:hypothetical protein|uniref:hypothetical protein n=1 Tax=unclassified Variovorax TaxID=663243 RepID=UPI000897A902|nr:MULTISPECIES: hypothetical protein [unclassified Variovorax]SDW22713.1 hypothetical protein SAMN05518669_101232 [Variovorax sp. YR634]SOD30013.1 hypothetical protein SAMN05518800_5617 [Variovorax sp. YR752]